MPKHSGTASSRSKKTPTITAAKKAVAKKTSPSLKRNAQTKNTVAKKKTTTKATKQSKTATTNTIGTSKKTPKTTKPSTSSKNKRGSARAKTTVIKRVSTLKDKKDKKQSRGTAAPASKKSTTTTTTKQLATIFSTRALTLSPEKTQSLMITTARFAGVFFVVAGAAFVFANAHIATSLTSQSANVITAQYTPEGNLSEIIPAVRDSLELDVQVASVDDSATVFTSTVLVEQAEKVVVSLINLSTGNQDFFLEADEIDQTTYSTRHEIDLLTQEQSYILVADVWIAGQSNPVATKKSQLIRVASGTEMESDGDVDGGSDEAVLTENTNSTDVVPDDTVSSAETVSNTTDIQPLSFTIEKKNEDRFEVNVAVEGADKVQLYRQHSDAISPSFVRTLDNNGAVWRTVFSTGSLRSGKHALWVTMATAQDTIESEKMYVTVTNNNETVLTDHDTTVNEEESDTSEPVAVAQDVPAELPTVVLRLPQETRYEGAVQVAASVDAARAVYWYVQPVGSTIERMVGASQKTSPSTWSATMQTTNIPNGSYRLYAIAKTRFGDIKSEDYAITVLNTQVPLPTSEALKERAQAVQNEIDRSSVVAKAEPTERSSIELRTEVSTTTPVGVPPQGQDFDTQIEDSIQPFREQIDSLLNRLTVAYRNQDEELQRTIESDLDALRSEIAATLSDDTSLSLRTRLTRRMNAIKDEYSERFARQQAFIEERQKSDVLKDTDQDGISDFDEVMLFNTDPADADSDNDGVIDGLEIRDGFDPLSAEEGQVLVYESPKESGVERNDLLSIEEFTPVQLVDEAATSTVGEEVTSTPHNNPDRVVALVKGTAPPNSFVTLYIFSTPVVVTVKTDAEGNWEYTFDKELEDGEHEVYVGITDNTGQIVAKSQPFRFVKEAQAITTVDQEAIADLQQPPPPTGIESQTSLLMVASISVVSIGLVLILLGMLLDRRRTGTTDAEQTLAV